MVTKVVIDNILQIDNTKFLLQGIDGIGSKTKYTVNELLSRHGAKLGNAVYENKQMALVIKVVGSTLGEMLANRDELLSYLSVKPYDQDDSRKFTFHLADSRKLFIQGVVKEVDIKLQARDTFATVIRVAIESYYPFFLSEQEYQITMNITQGGGAEVPMEVPLDMTQGATGYQQITNGGNVFTYPTIKFVGNLTNPVLLDVTNNKSLTLAHTLTGTGENITVDTFERTAIDELGNNVLDDMTGDFLIIGAGDNNFSLSTDTPSENGQAIITYRYAYGTF